MGRTIRRNVVSFDVPKSPKTNYFNIIDFKGLHISSNPFVNDTSSASDILNLYVNEDYVLTTRPRLQPSVFIDEESYNGDIKNIRVFNDIYYIEYENTSIISDFGDISIWSNKIFDILEIKFEDEFLVVIYVDDLKINKDYYEKDGEGIVNTFVKTELDVGYEPILHQGIVIGDIYSHPIFETLNIFKNSYKDRYFLEFDYDVDSLKKDLDVLEVIDKRVIDMITFKKVDNWSLKLDQINKNLVLYIDYYGQKHFITDEFEYSYTSPSKNVKYDNLFYNNDLSIVIYKNTLIKITDDNIIFEDLRDIPFDNNELDYNSLHQFESDNIIIKKEIIFNNNDFIIYFNFANNDNEFCNISFKIENGEFIIDKYTNLIFSWNDLKQIESHDFFENDNFYGEIFIDSEGLFNNYTYDRSVNSISGEKTTLLIEWYFKNNLSERYQIKSSLFMKPIKAKFHIYNNKPYIIIEYINATSWETNTISILDLENQNTSTWGNYSNPSYDYNVKFTTTGGNKLTILEGGPNTKYLKWFIQKDKILMVLNYGRNLGQEIFYFQKYKLFNLSDNSSINGDSFGINPIDIPKNYVNLELIINNDNKIFIDGTLPKVDIEPYVEVTKKVNEDTPGYDIWLKARSDYNGVKHSISFQNNRWLSSGKNVYRSEYGDITYIPTLDYKQLEYDVTGFNIITDELLGLYTKNNILFIMRQENIYIFLNARTGSGNIGETIITGYNEFPLHVNENGVFVLKSLENITTSSTNAICISDKINSELTNLDLSKVKVTNWSYWTLFSLGDKVYVLDNRDGEWYYWELPIEIFRFIIINNNLYALNKKGFELLQLTTEDVQRYLQSGDVRQLYTEYYDETEEGRKIINWRWKSQILPLDNINTHKQLLSTSFIFVDTDTKDDYGLEYSFRTFDKFLKEYKIPLTVDGELNYITTITRRTYLSKFMFMQLELTNIPDNLSNNKLYMTGLMFKYRYLRGGI